MVCSTLENPMAYYVAVLGPLISRCGGFGGMRWMAGTRETFMGAKVTWQLGD